MQLWEQEREKTLENIDINTESGIINNKEVRKWYIAEVQKILEHIEPDLPIEDRARIAFKERNRIRSQARRLMRDKELRELLEKEHPNKTFEELIESKMKRKGMTREEAIQDIYDTATKTNADINKELGLEGDE